MGTQDENNKAEPQNEFLSGFKLKDRTESQKEETQKPFFNQAEKHDRGIPYKNNASESISNKDSNPYKLTQQMEKNTPMGLMDNDSREKKKGVGLLKKVQSKFPKGKSNPADTKQKIMVVLIPVLFVVMILMFRQVLSKPPQEAQGAASNNETAPAVKKSSDSNIEWKIPDPLPVKKSTGIGGEQNTVSGSEQDNTANGTENGMMYIQSILYTNDRPSVVIGNKIVYLNEEINGAVVVEIKKDYVVFEKDGKKWTQKVAEEVQQKSIDQNIK